MLFDEICLAGACNRGICYLGSMQCLENEGLIDPSKLSKYIGTSIGSFIAACYSIGYSTEEMYDVIIKKDTSEFKDVKLNESYTAILKGEKYRQWVRDMFSKYVDPDITLDDLYKKTGKELIISIACVCAVEGSTFKEGINYCSYKTMPTLPLYIAVIASMSVPFIFPPVEYQGNYLVDGGLLDNFPMHLVNQDKCIGMRINFNTSEGKESVKHPISYASKLFELISQRLRELNCADTKYSIVVPCLDFAMIEFDMTVDDKITLYKRGFVEAQKKLDIFKHHQKEAKPFEKINNEVNMNEEDPFDDANEVSTNEVSTNEVSTNEVHNNERSDQLSTEERCAEIPQ